MMVSDPVVHFSTDFSLPFVRGPEKRERTLRKVGNANAKFCVGWRISMAPELFASRVLTLRPQCHFCPSPGPGATPSEIRSPGPEFPALRASGARSVGREPGIFH